MGCKRNKIKPLNHECPICYEVNSNNFILPCGHMFDYFCLQKTFFDYFIDGKILYCPLCRLNINKKTLKLIFKKIYVPHIYPINFINKNTLNLKNKVIINKYEKIKFNNNITYLIPCYKIEKINIQHFFHLNNIEFIYESFINELENIYKLKLTCLLDRKNNDWNKFIKNNNLNKFINSCSNNNDSPVNSISLYIRDPNNIAIYNERHGTAKTIFEFNDQKATISFRTFIVKWYDQLLFINELYGICYKN
jgi:hypothetical protein